MVFNMIKPISPKDRIILALDVDTLEEVEHLVTELKDYVGYFKIGLPLIVSYGFEAVRLIEKLGGKCYYDSKFHDIPNTVQKACINLVKNNIHVFNMHIQGGSKMVAGSVKAVKAAAKRLKKEPPIMLGVTLLSSFGQRTLTTELCVERSLEDYALQLAQVAYESGLNGVVASAEEAKRIRKEIQDDDFIIVCPAKFSSLCAEYWGYSYLFYIKAFDIFLPCGLLSCILPNLVGRNHRYIICQFFLSVHGGFHGNIFSEVLALYL
jgi:orotidine-5'-phosphate decarboxylase